MQMKEILEPRGLLSFSFQDLKYVTKSALGVNNLTLQCINYLISDL
jgi:hypothetical protein